MKNDTIQIARSTILWFEAYHPNHPEVLLADYDPDELELDVAGNFDYEITDDNLRHIYIDLETKVVPYGAIFVRSDFEFELNGDTWDDYFTHDFLYPMVKLSLQESGDAFKEACEEEQITLPRDIPVQDKFIISICESVIDLYFTIFKPYDLANAELRNTIAFDCPQCNAAFITMQGTFLVIDEIIYHNPLFNRKHNQHVFGNYVPLMKYNTLRAKCMDIVKHPVKLSSYNTILFYTCVDCAMQMLLGDKSDVLAIACDARGMTSEVRTLFYRLATELFDMVYKNPDQTQTGMADQRAMHDWNALFK